MTTPPSPKPIIVLYHYTLQAKEGEERAPKYHTIIIWFMTCDSPLQKVSYGMYYCTQSAPLNTIIVPIKGAALSGLLPPHPVTPSGWLLSKKVIILTLATQLQKETYTIVWSLDLLKPFRWLFRLIGLKQTKQLPPLLHVQTRADLISKITGCDYLLWVLCISLYNES